MHNKLAPIVLQKQREVADLYQRLQSDATHPIANILHGALSVQPVNFKKALKSSLLAVIAEIKRQSPSKGRLALIPDAGHLAQQYIQGGASALSIVTDKKFFDGHIDDLIQVSRVVTQPPIPILRKDFIIDKIQIAESAVFGASAILCIIAVVGLQAKSFIEFSHAIGLDVLVEIHDLEELKIALDCGADIIGINNRHLNTFAVDTAASLRMVNAIPSTIIKIAESGIMDPALARQYYQAGFDAVLIGEALVQSTDPIKFIRDCRYE